MQTQPPLNKTEKGRRLLVSRSAAPPAAAAAAVVVVAVVVHLAEQPLLFDEYTRSFGFNEAFRDNGEREKERKKEKERRTNIILRTR